MRVKRRSNSSRRQPRQRAKSNPDVGAFWYSFCCAEYWLHHATENNIREEDDRKIYQKLNTPFVEATLLTLLIVEIILSGVDVFLERLVSWSRMEMRSTFCGFGDPSSSGDIYCYGSGDAFNTSSSTYYVDRIDELKDKIRVMQIMSLLTVVFSIVTVILFAAESFMFMYYLGRKFCKYPLLVLDLIFVLLSLMCLLVDLAYAISFCENKVSLASEFYKTYFQDNPDEATSCVIPSELFNTSSIDHSYACENQVTSKYVKHAGRLLLVFRLWRLIRVFKSIFEHQEKKSRLEASHASAMAKFVAKTTLMLRQQREKDNAYLNQVLGKKWSLLLGVVRGDRLKEKRKKKSSVISMSSNSDPEPAIGMSHEGVIHDIGSTFRNVLNDVAISKRRQSGRRRGTVSSHMTHDIHIVVKTVRSILFHKMKILRHTEQFNTSTGTQWSREMGQKERTKI